MSAAEDATDGRIAYRKDGRVTLIGLDRPAKRRRWAKSALSALVIWERRWLQT